MTVAVVLLRKRLSESPIFRFIVCPVIHFLFKQIILAICLGFLLFSVSLHLIFLFKIQKFLNSASLIS